MPNLDTNVSLEYLGCYAQVEAFIKEKTQKNMQEVEALDKVLKSTMKLISVFNNPSSQKQVDFSEDERLRSHFNQLFIYNPSLIGLLHPKAEYSDQKCKDIAKAVEEGHLDALPSALYLFDTKDFPYLVDALSNQKELIPNKISQKSSEISHEADNMTDFSRMSTKALEKDDRAKATMVRNQRG